MALTGELDLHRVKVNYAKYHLGQRSFRSKVIVRTDAQTHTAHRVLYLDHKVVGNMLEYWQVTYQFPRSSTAQAVKTMATKICV